ncbi:hypothetical protein [Polymorphospora rubra]|uniref:hypothetical protein n=1 Tax=Polymorphospora rubra TaxID=338584 RepID=UPI0031D820A4
MKRHDRGIEELVTRARPRTRAGFTTSPQGERTLARILNTPRGSEKRSRRKPLTIAAAVTVGLLFAGGATAAIGSYQAPTAPPEAIPADGDAFVCATAGMRRAGEGLARAGETPVDACRRSWTDIFGEKPPTHLHACVQRLAAASPSQGAGVSPSPVWGKLVYVIDGEQFRNPAETCGSVDMLVAPPGN